MKECECCSFLLCYEMGVSGIFLSLFTSGVGALGMHIVSDAFDSYRSF